MKFTVHIEAVKNYKIRDLEACFSDDQMDRVRMVSSSESQRLLFDIKELQSDCIGIDALEVFRNTIRKETEYKGELPAEIFIDNRYAFIEEVSRRLSIYTVFEIPEDIAKKSKAFQNCTSVKVTVGIPFFMQNFIVYSLCINARDIKEKPSFSFFGSKSKTQKNQHISTVSISYILSTDKFIKFWESVNFATDIPLNMWTALPSTSLLSERIIISGF